MSRGEGARARIRRATLADAEELQRVRRAVRENRLSDPSRVTLDDVRDRLAGLGLGWVAEVGGRIVGFAIADLPTRNIWALFLEPEYERRGIGRRLHDTMMDAVFEATSARVWLSTSPGTRAESFYRAAGWLDTGRTANGEIRFEMSPADWKWGGGRAESPTTSPGPDESASAS